MIEKIEHIEDDDQEKLLEKLENMNLVWRINDQKVFLKMYFDSSAYASALRNELSAYDILKDGKNKFAEAELINDTWKLSDEDQKLFDYIKNNKKKYLSEINIKSARVEDSDYGWLSIFGQKNKNKETNMKWWDQDPFVKKANKMVDDGELKDLDILLNDIDDASITSPIHEIYHILEDRKSVV